jgi:putative Mg2+ transporter-C (MgtC) family protein
MEIELFTIQHWQEVAGVLLKLGLGVLLAGAVGWEREIHGRPAGVRTHMLVALGTMLFSEVGAAFGGDPARVAAQVVTGIGFLGAGTILRTGGEIRGLTTAASIWAVAAISMAVAAGGAFMTIAVAGTILALITLTWVDRLERRFLRPVQHKRLRVRMEDLSAVGAALKVFERHDIRIEHLNVVSRSDAKELEVTVMGPVELAIPELADTPGVWEVVLTE